MPPVEEDRGQGEVILLAEDNEYVREIMLTTLENAGYAVLDAADGEEAMRCFSAQPERARLAILDLDLPRKSGEQCLREMRETRRDLSVWLGPDW